MATCVVGVGNVGNRSAQVVTFPTPIHGQGLTSLATFDYLLNLTRGTTLAIASTTTTADRSKVDTVTVTGDASAWQNGDRYALMIGNGTTTYATTALALAAVGANDVIVVTPLDTEGNRHTVAATTTIATVCTVETDIIGEKNTWKSNASGGAQIILSVAVTFRDFYGLIGTANYAFRVTNSTGDALVERCTLVSLSEEIFTGNNTGGTVTFNACIAIGAGYDGFVSIGASSDVYCYYCLAIFSVGNGFFKYQGSLVCKNCAGWKNATKDFSTGITQSYNASSDATAAGTGSLTSQTLPQFRFAFYVVTGRPFDFRTLNGGSALENAGNAVTNMDYDYDGYARADGGNPDIGPSQGRDTGIFGGGGLLVHPGTSGGMRS